MKSFLPFTLHDCIERLENCDGRVHAPFFIEVDNVLFTGKQSQRVEHRVNMTTLMVKPKTPFNNVHFGIFNKKIHIHTVDVLLTNLYLLRKMNVLSSKNVTITVGNNLVSNLVKSISLIVTHQYTSDCKYTPTNKLQFNTYSYKYRWCDVPMLNPYAFLLDLEYDLNIVRAHNKTTMFDDESIAILKKYAEQIKMIPEDKAAYIWQFNETIIVSLGGEKYHEETHFTMPEELCSIVMKPSDFHKRSIKAFSRVHWYQVKWHATVADMAYKGTSRVKLLHALDQTHTELDNSIEREHQLTVAPTVLENDISKYLEDDHFHNLMVLKKYPKSIKQVPSDKVVCLWQFNNNIRVQLVEKKSLIRDTLVMPPTLCGMGMRSSEFEITQFMSMPCVRWYRCLWSPSVSQMADSSVGRVEILQELQDTYDVLKNANIEHKQPPTTTTIGTELVDLPRVEILRQLQTALDVLDSGVNTKPKQTSSTTTVGTEPILDLALDDAARLKMIQRLSLQYFYDTHNDEEKRLAFKAFISALHDIVQHDTPELMKYMKILIMTAFDKK